MIRDKIVRDSGVHAFARKYAGRLYLYLANIYDPPLINKAIMMLTNITNWNQL